jgi:molecular chaperone DnaJ
MQDPYQIIGVSKDASEEEIKKAFRQKAHKLHPDKDGGDEAKFKELNAAYQILGNKEKRAQYDQYGPAFEQMGGFGGGGQGPFGGFGGQGVNINMEDLGDLGSIFGDMFGFGGGGGGSRKPKRGRHIEMDTQISFRDSVFGAEKEISLYRHLTCDDCAGTGAAKGTKLGQCMVCKGAGQVKTVRQSVFGAFQSVGPCQACQGQGEVPETPCKKCSGSGITKGDRAIKLKIPAGINDGEILRVSGEGEPGGRGGLPGDLYVTVRVKGDKNFRRQGYDILTTQEIPMPLAALGGKVDTETVDGPVELKIPAGTQSHSEFRLKAKGVPHLRRTGRGDHLVTVKVEIPKKLSRKQKKALEEWDS